MQTTYNHSFDSLSKKWTELRNTFFLVLVGPIVTLQKIFIIVSGPYGLETRNLSVYFIHTLFLFHALMEECMKYFFVH